MQVQKNHIGESMTLLDKQKQREQEGLARFRQRPAKNEEVAATLKQAPTNQEKPVGTVLRTELPLQLLELEHPPITSIDRNLALKEEKAACLLDLSPETLKKWRKRGVGPNYVQYGTEGPVRYLLNDLLDFRAIHTIKTKPMPELHEARNPRKGKRAIAH